jgi:ubiquitin-protein ligase
MFAYLKAKLSLALQIHTALLSAPDPDDPVAQDVASHLKTNKTQVMEILKSTD